MARCTAQHRPSSIPRSNKGWSGERRASAEQLPVEGDDRGPVAAPGRGRVRPAHRLRRTWRTCCCARGTVAPARGRSALFAGGDAAAQVFAQFLTESVVLAAIGGVLWASILAVAAPAGIVAVMPPLTLPSEADVRLSIPVLLFTLAACDPVRHALRAARPRGRPRGSNLVETLKEAGRSVGGRRAASACAARSWSRSSRSPSPCLVRRQASPSTAWSSS